MDFFRQGRKDGGSFDSGIDLALRRVLASPKFIFRTERDPAGIAAGAAYRVSDIDLASRLSFFIWSSIPDDELLDLAARGALSRPATFERQMRRMLADPKAQSLVDNSDSAASNGGAAELARVPGFRRQPASGAPRGNRAVLRVDHSRGSQRPRFDERRLHVRERAAGPPLRDPERLRQPFRRVTPTRPAGVCSARVPLMVTSHPHRTSPVIRGKWVLENILALRRHRLPTSSRRSRRRRPRRGRSRCVSGSRRIGGIPRAPAVTA